MLIPGVHPPFQGELNRSKSVRLRVDDELLHPCFLRIQTLIAQRPIWRGHLRLALVSCQVALYNARHDRDTIHLHMINPKTGNRIRMVTQDAQTGEPVARGNTVKGYEIEKGRCVIVSQEDLDSVKVESSSMMAVEKFLDASSIDPIYYDASYYLAPDGKGSEDVYAVLREAIEKTGKVALTRVVISQRERTVALRPLDGGLVAHTLNEDRDLNSAVPLFEPLEHVRIDPEMVTLATQLIKRQTAEFDPADLEDRYETRMRAMIDAKVKGQGPVVEGTKPESDSNVVDLMAALRASLLGGTQRPGGAQRPAQPAAAAVVADSGRQTTAGKQAKDPAPAELRKQPGLKLAIKGGKERAQVQAAPQARDQPVPIGRSRRKAS